MCMIISRYEDEACIDDDYSCFDDDFTNTDDDFTLYDEFAGMLPEEINDYYVEDDVLEYIRYFYFCKRFIRKVYAVRTVNFLG